MNFIFRYLVVSLAAFALFSCNTLSWMDNKNSAEALQDEIDFAFINGNCSEVVNLLQNQANLSPSNQYKLTNAILCQSGMNLMSSIDIILDNVSGASPYSIIQSIMGASVITPDNIDSLRAGYTKAINQCNAASASGSIDDSLQTVCGFAAAARTVLIVSEVAMGVTGSQSVEITEEGIKNALQGKNETDVKNYLDNLPQDKQDSLYTNLSEDLNIVSDSVGVIENVMKTDSLSGQFSNFTSSLTNGSGKVDNVSLSNYLTNVLGNDK